MNIEKLNIKTIWFHCQLGSIIRIKGRIKELKQRAYFVSKAGNEAQANQIRASIEDLDRAMQHLRKNNLKIAEEKAETHEYVCTAEYPRANRQPGESATIKVYSLRPKNA
jgi:LPS O-antigen subunit length determinant protein (WzzB/FepE family)